MDSLIRTASLAWLGALLLLIPLVGCQSGQATRQRSALPPDLSVEFYLDGSAASADPFLHRSRYVLEADRGLHIDVHPTAGRYTYPPLILFLNVAQMQKIGRLVRDENLMAEPSAVSADATPTDDQPVYHVSLAAWGKTHHCVTMPKHSPAMRQLLALLIKAGKVRPAADTPRILSPVTESP